MTDIRDDAADGFAELFGYSPHGIWSAPGSVTLLGGDTVALSIAINRRVVVAVGVRDDDVLRVASELADEVASIRLSELTPERLVGWSAYPFGVAWALGALGADLSAVPGIDVYVESTVPVASGLSSSAALESAVAVALDEVWQLGLDGAQLAKAGWLSERGPGAGPLDQLAVMLGRPDHAILVDGASLETTPIVLDFETAGVSVLVIDTDVSNADALRAEAVDDQRVLEAADALHDGDLHAFGRMLDGSHPALHELDLAIETAHANGALGARTIGGGSVIALVPADAVSRIQVALDGAFAEHGFAAPVAFTVATSHGAIRER
jgi:galactokinase